MLTKKKDRYYLTWIKNPQHPKVLEEALAVWDTSINQTPIAMIYCCTKNPESKQKYQNLLEIAIKQQENASNLTPKQ